MFGNKKENNEYAKPHIVICDICGRGTIPQKPMIYIAEEPRGVMDTLTQPPKRFDAMDCPCCGCQIILKRRYPRADGEPETEQDGAGEAE